MNISQALTYGREILVNRPEATLDARLLLEYVLDIGYPTMAAHPDRGLSPAVERRYLDALARAVQGEPIPYIIGLAPFYGRYFEVNQAVLIPRPETELLVDNALTWLERDSRAKVVDVGTGSGCIAITVALHCPTALVQATEISDDALKTARSNAQKHSVLEVVQFHKGSLLEPISGQVDLILANLPYIADDEWADVDDGVKLYEPEFALKGGPDGLVLIGQLLDQATSRLASGGAIILEIGWRQGPAAKRLARRYFPQTNIKIGTDLSGLDRIVIIDTRQQLLERSGLDLDANRR